MIYLVSIAVFAGIILFLVGLLLMVEAAVATSGEHHIVVNDDEDHPMDVSGTPTLLSALVNRGILLPSACGGGGSCGMCKCQVESGGGDVLPTELTHLTRVEKKRGVRIACQVKVKSNMRIHVPEEVFNIKKFSGTVESNSNVATYIKELIIKLDSDEMLDFEAGAYIQIDIPEYEISFTDFHIEEEYRDEWDSCNLWQYRATLDEPIYRAYSLANPPSEKNRLMLTVRIATPPSEAPDAPPGLGSTYLFNLKPGDKVSLSGPYGDFFVKETDREMCFVGGGAGMAPMRCHIMHQFLTLNTKRKATFWYGARSRREMFYDEEFRELEKKYDNFEYHVALSLPLPQDNWEGDTGFIHTVLLKNYLADHEDPTEIEYYLCGPPLMIDAVLDMLDSLGVEPEMIHYDKF